jgi:hypothetical protein
MGKTAIAARAGLLAAVRQSIAFSEKDLLLSQVSVLHTPR